jgi:hypothetical protein
MELSQEIIITEKELKLAIRSISLKLINTINNYFGNNLKEARNDIKFIIRNSALETPKKFELMPITEKNKNHIIRYLVSMKNNIGIKHQTSEFHKKMNEIIDNIFSDKVLNDLVDKDAKKSYEAIIERVGEELQKSNITIENLSTAESRSLSVNIFKKIGEVFSIKMIAPNTSTKPKVPGGSYYRHEPNTGKYPDFVFIFGDNPNSDAIRIRNMFNIPKDVDRINVESKISTRIVGTQTSPEKYKLKLNDDKLFDKITSIKVGDEKSLSGLELRKLLNADNIEIDTIVAYLDPSGKTKTTQSKVFKKKIDGQEVFSIKRTSNGQFKIFNGDGNDIFGIEVGRVAYESGLFKEGVKCFL